jgi:rare lipoprotein A
MVTNLENGRSTEVTINDRGPFVKGRIIDLSYAAAQALWMIGPGTAPVFIEVIESGPYEIQAIRSNLDYTLQVGSFTDLEKALRLRQGLEERYPMKDQIVIVPFQGEEATYYRVQLGIFFNRPEAEEHAGKLALEGFPVIIMEK